ncbi:Lrp/AsnC family transcriptional regulator [Humibacter sp.]|jgi:DNA-binding Lrp family transcriptional regulator|uniref:Lrp/AsnC family transcriptional regulator n=1 Tax=Humibacter sp. TaxID=1940291 RepID=UPI003F82220F
MNVDKVDRAIIAQLSADSRLSVRALAERVHVSRSAVANRLQRLIADGVIEGFGARVDRKAIGLHVTALVIVKVERQPGWQDVASALSALPFVESVLAVSGDIDFVITVSAPDHESLSDVIMRQLHEVDGVASTRSYIVLESWDGTAPGIARDSWDA